MAYIKKKEASKQEIAYQRIKQAIIDNELPADTVLIEDNLCEMLGFSKTPIREALKRLATEGFVESIPEKATYVKKIGIDEAVEMYDVREVLEGLAARLCALRRDKKTLDLLLRITQELKTAMDKKNNTDSIRLDMEFHETIINGSHNVKLIGFSRTIIEQIRRFAADTIYERQVQSLQEHECVYEAINSGDSESAERLIREHIRGVKEYQIGKHFLISRPS